ncbi:MAG: hypothetical protein O7G85_15705 [Planctomycetota bacterium]|nr:hypothetical protein [Planctomycetota bacterium]
MKNVALLAVLVVGFGACTLVWAGDQDAKKKAGWFDAAACGMCKPMTEYPELMTSMKWETHKIKDGMLMVTSIPEEHRKTFEAVCTKMQENGRQLATRGESVDLCGHCESFGKLMQAGVRQEKIMTAFGHIALVTANDPTTVELIHKHAEQSQDETKKMLANKN